MLKNLLSVSFFFSFFSFCFLKELNTFIQEGPIKLVKSDSKDFNNNA